jgi:hypothetical protein
MRARSVTRDEVQSIIERAQPKAEKKSMIDDRPGRGGRSTLGEDSHGITRSAEVRHYRLSLKHQSPGRTSSNLDYEVAGVLREPCIPQKTIDL